MDDRCRLRWGGAGRGQHKSRGSNGKITRLFVTHYHADHAGALAFMRKHYHQFK